MIEQAEQLATNHGQPIVNTAVTQMQNLQQTELQRLRALAEVNPNIRQEEIDHLLEQSNELQHFLNSASSSLDALRVAIVTE